MSLFVIPTLHLFDRKNQRIWCEIILAVNVALTAAFLLFWFPEDREAFVLTPEMARLSVIVAIVAITLATGLMIYLNDLANQVYEEVNITIEENTREKEQFFATISHEIRNPLQSLQGSVELLAEMGKSGHDSPAQFHADVQPLLEICKGCCGLVINMVSNILDMSKIAADKMQLSPVPTDLREVSNRILRASRGRAEGKSVALSLACDPLLPPAVEVDPQRVEQIVINLVSNAIKFTPTKGRIVIKVSWTELEGGEDLDAVVQQTLARSSWKQSIELEEGASPADTPRHQLASSVRIQTRTSRLSRAGSLTLVKLSRQRDRPSMCTFHDCVGSESHPGIPTAKARRGIVKIEVMDSGIGISKEGIGKLFRPYQQADQTISRFTRGV